MSSCADRPCLEDRSRVQRVQRSVVLGLTHILQRDNQETLLHKVHSSALSVMSSCELKDMVWTEWHAYIFSPCSCTRRGPCCVHCVTFTQRSCAGLANATHTQLTPCSLLSTGSCLPQTPSSCQGTLTRKQQTTQQTTTELIFLMTEKEKKKK